VVHKKWAKLTCGPKIQQAQLRINDFYVGKKGIVSIDT